MTANASTGLSAAKGETGEEFGTERRLGGTQTLIRGLDVMNAVAEGAETLSDVAAALGLARSTVHRLAATLIEQRYLEFQRNRGYSLGSKLLELGYLARQQLSLPRLARRHLEDLSAQSSDTVHLGVLEDDHALYLDKIPGRRRVEIGSRIGERQPLRSTGLGKALIIDETEAKWRELFNAGEKDGGRYDVELSLWLKRMHHYAACGYTFDMEENEDKIRCVAAPVRDASGQIAAAISISSAAQYMDEARMHRLTGEVIASAAAISRELGWNGDRSDRPNDRAESTQRGKGAVGR